jgi:hypothetical protein
VSNPTAPRYASKIPDLPSTSRFGVISATGRRLSRPTEMARNAVQIEGDRKTAKMLETWLQLEAASSPDDADSHAPTWPVRSQPAKRLQGFRQAPGRIIPGCGLPTIANVFDGGLAIVASARCRGR